MSIVAGENVADPIPAGSGLSCLVLGGCRSSASSWPPDADDIGASLTRWRDRCTVTVDVNHRPPSFPAADSDPLDVAKARLADRPELVVLTHGEAGASAHLTGAPPVVMPAPSVVVADTLGAGGALTGTLRVHLGAGGRAGVRSDFPGFLRYACGAAVAHTRPGAYAPDPAQATAVAAPHMSEE